MSTSFDAVLCDIDGCLGPESTAPLDPAALAQVAEMNRRAITSGNGPVVTVCTGRPLPYAEAICRLIHNNQIPCICEMGVWMLDLRTHEYLMDPAITDANRRHVREAQAWIEATLLPKGVIIQPGKSASVSLWHSDTSALMAFKPLIEETFAREGWNLRVSSTVAWINCDLRHVSKASGIRRFQDRTGLRRERLAGIGDTMGDMAIREHVAFFACPANAHPDLKSHADYVSPLAEAAGVVDILTRLM
jgi:hydroxymethylpyrimidine pyrophosphatase-like HAD family hydrolase